MPPIPVIDLFAGPGGLGEGFSALRRSGESAFKIALSIEKDVHAHRTLELRAFFRQFPHGHAPDEYYDYLARRISREELFNAYRSEAHLARTEAWNATLGVTAAREVDTRITAALNGRADWLLIGGPPCQAYSLVGRSKIIGEKGRKEYEADHRHLLYREYLRIIAEHQPPVFVMENVKGLLSARIKNESTLSLILRDLQHPLEAIHGPRHRQGQLAYRLVSVVVPPTQLFGDFDPGDFIVQAEDYGVPQSRHRLIIVGLADGVATPRLLQRKPTATVAQAINDLPRVRSGLSKEPDSAAQWQQAILSMGNAEWLDGPQVDDGVRQEIRRLLAGVTAGLGRGGEWVRRTRRSVDLHPEWFLDERLNGICNHTTRAHIRADLHRYFFLAASARVHGRSPLLDDFPAALLPEHKNVAEALRGFKFNDRFRVQVAGRPSTTVVSHISQDGHYFIHPDATQCRSLTVREAARLQTFPDNYFFEGPRTEQYHQVGNAVPPFLAHQIADIVADLFPHA